MPSTAEQLARWALTLDPTADDRALARRALTDTLAVTLAARGEPVVDVAATLPDAGRWAAVGHVLDFDDLHLPSTTHISVVCVPAALATGGDDRAYLAGAGVMARLGAALGWRHYTRGWHATCTAGAPAAAAAAAVALELSTEQTVAALALAVPAAGGVQRAFGSMGKSLQVGFAAAAGVRAARLAAAGADADPTALDQWLALLGGDAADLDLEGPAVPGGLAIKLHPCCYALQRPIAAVREGLPGDLVADDVTAISVRTPTGTVQPLVHEAPTTGLQGKFSLEYGLATALLDERPGFAAFTDDAVRRDAAQRLIGLVDPTFTDGGDGLLAGEVEVTVVVDGDRHTATLADPPGAPRRPPSDEELGAKVADCGDDVQGLLDGIDWSGAADLLASHLPAG